jgi:hypothetical protein
MPTDEAKRGSDAEFCSKWPFDGHAMQSRRASGTSIWVRVCLPCGWIDGADLEEQRLAAIAEGRRQAAADIRAELGSKPFMAGEYAEWAARLAEGTPREGEHG